MLWNILGKCMYTGISQVSTRILHIELPYGYINHKEAHIRPEHTQSAYLKIKRLI